MSVTKGVLILNTGRLAEILRSELSGWVGAPGAACDPHSWRCYHVDRYGECDCLDQMVGDVLNALDVPASVDMEPK